jgi:hypothetical protein
VVDLVEYRSGVSGIFMRHILEHNYEWARILDNALASFTQRMALILFTPEQETTQRIAFDSDIGVPDIAFRLADITDRFPPDVTYTVQRIQSGTQYGCETILLRATSGRGRSHALIQRLLLNRRPPLPQRGMLREQRKPPQLLEAA